MKHIGIIAEYNPFHHGHLYQLNQVREQFPDKKIIVMMSGDYVQRGEPAIFHKHLRAKCALRCGADIIFELPAPFSFASAEYFGTVALSALSATGLVDTLCFGAEDDAPAAFSAIADILLQEPDNYRSALKEALSRGDSYPKARDKALSACLLDSDTATLIRKPNNILAIEYMKAIRRFAFPIRPHIIRRIGAGYHDTETKQAFCSASAIRNALAGEYRDMSSFMPDAAYEELEKSPYAKPLFFQDFYPLLQYALLNQSSYTEYFEISNDLPNRLSRIGLYPASLEALIEELSGKHITDTRLRRALLNLLLQERKLPGIGAARQLPYLRLLGFRESARPLLKEMKDSCPLPIINKVADAENILPKAAVMRFQKDIQESHLYRQVFYNKYSIILPTEYEQSVIIEE